MKKILLGSLLMLSSLQAFAYECKPAAVDVTEKSELTMMKNEVVFNGLIHELIQKDLPQNPANARKLSEHLIGAETNKDKRALVKLLVYTSDLKKKKPRTLELKEICEIVEKVNKLPAETKK